MKHYLVGGLEPYIYFPMTIGNVIIPIDGPYFFRGVAQPPTSYVTGSCWVHFAYGPMVRDIPGLSLARKGIETEAAGRFKTCFLLWLLCVPSQRTAFCVPRNIPMDHDALNVSLCWGWAFRKLAINLPRVWRCFLGRVFFLRITAASGGTALVKFVGNFKT